MLLVPLFRLISSEALLRHDLSLKASPTSGIVVLDSEKRRSSSDSFQEAESFYRPDVKKA